MFHFSLLSFLHIFAPEFGNRVYRCKGIRCKSGAVPAAVILFYNTCSSKPLRNREGERVGGKPEDLPRLGATLPRTFLKLLGATLPRTKIIDVHTHRIMRDNTRLL
jgi:hypothetical protein